ncbi:beta subunit of citrate lyase [Thozetella sp. PMI_491]|nr:beta subunit of citrate lyase [Thozetella sp. PMI_491]
MAQSPPFLRRALLYVPGASQKMLDKSRTLEVDTLIYDLEDSVTLDAKSAARSLVARHIADASLGHAQRTPKEVSVRINAVDTGLALQDLTEVATIGGSNLDTIVVPKVESEADLQFVTDVLRHVAPHRVPESGGKQPPLSIIALIESARGLTNLHNICRAGQALGVLSGLGFAAEDFATDLSLSPLPNRRELLYARSTLVTAARAHGIPSVLDMVSVGSPITDTIRAALEEESRDGRAMGFTGKQCIHPLQVGIVSKAFGPTTKELEWALRVVIGNARSSNEGKGAWSLDGKMIDAPVVKRAAALVARAKMCGADITSLEAQLQNTEGIVAL